MSDSTAACTRGRARPSWSRTQGEAHAGGMGEPEDADPAQVSRVIRVRGVVESLIYLRKALRPGYVASAPSASSIRSSWLYFATRSERDGAPVLICPQPVATARAAIVVSSVSPERCDITAV